MSFLKRLFGGSGAASAKQLEIDPIDYNGFTIRPTPINEGGQYQCCGVISKELGGETKQHRFIRADKFPSLDDAVSTILRKGQRIVDEQGDRMFE